MRLSGRPPQSASRFRAGTLRKFRILETDIHLGRQQGCGAEHLSIDGLECSNAMGERDGCTYGWTKVDDRSQILFSVERPGF